MERVANIDEIPKDKFWNVSTVYDTEKQRIEEFILSKVARNLPPHVAGGDQEAAKQAITGALRFEVQQEVSGVFANLEDQANWDPDLISKAMENTFKNMAPETGEIFWAFWVRNLTIVLELVVFSLMIVSDGASPFILIIAVLLALGGYFTGLGTSLLMIPKEISMSKIKSKNMNILLLIVGLVLVVGITWFRASQSDNPAAAAAITLLLGLTIVFSEAFYSYKKKFLVYAQIKQFTAQQYYASLYHDRDKEEDHWNKRYRDEVMRIAILYKLLAGDDIKQDPEA